MMMQKHMHSRALKLDAVRPLTTGQQHPAPPCRAYGIAENILSRCSNEYQERGEAAFQTPQGAGPTTHEQRIAESEPGCGPLALENQILKNSLQPLESRSGMR